MELKLKDIRKAAGMTQSQLGYSIGATKRQVGAWERGENELPLSVAFDICEVFGCTLDELAGRRPAAPRRSVDVSSLSDGGRQAVEEFAEFTRHRELAARASENGDKKGEVA